MMGEVLVPEGCAKYWEAQASWGRGPPGAGAQGSVFLLGIPNAKGEVGCGRAGDADPLN